MNKCLDLSNTRTTGENKKPSKVSVYDYKLFVNDQLN